MKKISRKLDFIYLLRLSYTHLKNCIFFSILEPYVYCCCLMDSKLQIINLFWRRKTTVPRSLFRNKRFMLDEMTEQNASKFDIFIMNALVCGLYVDILTRAFIGFSYFSLRHFIIKHKPLISEEFCIINLVPSKYLGR